MHFKFKIAGSDKLWKALKQAAKTAKANGDQVKVGVLADGQKNHREGEGITNAELAIIHEFGSPEAGIPERSFVRSTFEAKRPEYIEMLRKLVKGIYLQKMTTDRALGLVGAEMAADIKNTIRAGIPPENAPSTIERKGSSTPLVDTGQLLNSVTWALEKKGGEDDHGGGGHH